MSFLITRPRSQERFPSFFSSNGLANPNWFDDFFTNVARGDLSVRVDVKDSDDHITVYADLPGVEEKNIDLTLEDQTLILKGEKKSEKKEEHKDSWYFERSFGSFVRAIPLPSEVQFDSASATFKNGVLEVTLPKALEAQSKTRKIKIN